MLRLEVEVLRHLLMKLPAVYQPKTLTDMEAEAAIEQEKEDAIREEKREKKLGRHIRPARVEAPKAEVKVEKPVEKAVAKAPKQEAAEEAPKETVKKTKEAPKKKDEDKKALEDIDAKLDSILSNPDINF